MNHLDLFSGIGGFALAAEWAGIDTVGFSEINQYACAVLNKNFPDIPNLGDVKELTSMPIFNIIKVCHVLKTLSTITQPNSILTECPLRLSPTSTESPDKLCIKYSFGEVLSSVLKSKEAQTIASTEEVLGRAIMPITLLNTLSARVLSNAEQLAMGADALQSLRMAEQEYKHTTPTITSLLRLCGSVRNVITNGTNTIPLLPAYEFSTENANAQGIDLLTAGVPCQPSSVAGKRRGQQDDRWLWPQTLEIVRVFRPRWVILENVGGFITIDNGMALESTCAFLEAEGYEVQPIIIPACAVGAPHRRDRVWIIANSRRKSDGDESTRLDSERLNGDAQGERPTQGNRLADEDSEPSSDAMCRGQQGQGKYRGPLHTEADCFGKNHWSNHGSEQQESWHEAATRLCRVDDGVPSRVDRIKCLGNSIVPQVAYEILKTIKDIYND